MTAFPDQSSAFEARRSLPKIRGPRIREHFWGLEVKANDRSLSSALVLRIVAIFGFAAVVGAAVTVWSPSHFGFWYGLLAARIMMTIMLLVAGAGLARYASRGTTVYIQVDTTAGELREVVYTVFGEAIVLARYGVDSVRAIRICRSVLQPSVGQIQIEVDGVGSIPAGIGDAGALVPLRDRMRVEMGVCQEGGARPAVWSGPRAA